MSNSERKYLIDANILIDAHRRYYAFDICPGFWESILHYYSKNSIFSIDKIKIEILNGKTKLDKLDALGLWVKQSAPNDMFLTTNDVAVSNVFSSMMQWVQSKPFTDPAKTEFASVADGWIVAFAKVHGFVVVTQEAFNPERKSKVQIPNVCKQFDVDFCDTFAMLRELKIQYSWK